MQNPPIKVRSTLVNLNARNVLIEAGVYYPPVPAKQLLEKYTIVKWFDHPTEEGFCFKKDGVYYTCLNRAMVRGRDNYTYGHELGHIVMGHLDINYDVATEYHFAKIKREADLFAACLLMPEEWVRTSCSGSPPSLQAIGDMVRVFDVSWEAMTIRLEQLDICCRDYVRWMWDNKAGRC